MNENKPQQLSSSEMKLFVEQWIKIRPMSQQDIANVINIPQVQLSRFEHLNLRQDIMEKYQRQICKYFKVTPKDIIYGNTTFKKKKNLVSATQNPQNKY